MKFDNFDYIKIKNMCKDKNIINKLKGKKQTLKEHLHMAYMGIKCQCLQYKHNGYTLVIKI